MWKLKYVYRHKSCEYTSKLAELGIAMQWYPLNTWIEKSNRFITALLLCSGPQEKIDKFFRYIGTISTCTERVSAHSLLHVRKTSIKNVYYDPLYNQQLIFARPILHKNGLEYTEVCCFTKEPLAALLLARRHAKDTEVLDLKMFGQERINDIHLLNVVPSLTGKQHELFQLAMAKGYYNHPRKITLTELAKLRKLSKSAVHESLRRAESHMFKELE